MLVVDFETRSRVNLLTAGAYNYALDRSTTALCCAFIDIDTDYEFLWTPQKCLTAKLLELIACADYIAAHNAQFDRLIWEEVAVLDHAFPEIDFDRWYCTSAQCRVNGLPANLEDAARALDTQHKKDSRGKQLIRLLSIPQADGTFNNDPVLLAEMGDYCMQDARTTVALVRATRMLTPVEHEDWLINEDINERGVMIDVELAGAAQQYATAETIEIADQLHQNSGGVITKHTQSVRAAKWVADQLGENHPALKHMLVWKADEQKLTLDKDAREALLAGDELGDYELPDDVFNVITLLDESSQSSVSKFKNMMQRADPETQRLHGAFIYAGASQTLRFSSRGMQIHNMPQRGGFKTVEELDGAHQKILSGAQFDEPVMPILKNLLRWSIKAAPGKTLVIGDWKGIEARVLPWLADSPGALEKLALIAEGADVYQLTADRIGLPERRDIGKVMELACGYGGGVRAFIQFAKGYGIEAMASSHIQRLIYAWRDLNAWVATFWHDLEGAARAAIKHPDRPYRVGRIGFYFASELMQGSLLMILPDGTVLTYPQCRIDYDKEYGSQITALKASVKMRADGKVWPRETLYGGKFAGHATQGTAAALLRDLLTRIEAVIAHVHDEVILEVLESWAEAFRVKLQREMRATPEWAAGLPLDAEPFISPRFRK